MLLDFDSLENFQRGNVVYTQGAQKLCTIHLFYIGVSQPLGRGPAHVLYGTGPHVCAICHVNYGDRA